MAAFAMLFRVVVIILLALLILIGNLEKKSGKFSPSIGSHKVPKMLLFIVDRHVFQKRGQTRNLSFLHDC